MPMGSQPGNYGELADPYEFDPDDDEGIPPGENRQPVGVNPDTMEPIGPPIDTEFTGYPDPEVGVGSGSSSDVNLGYETTGLGGTELGETYSGMLSDVQNRDDASLTGVTMVAADGPTAGSATAGQADVMEDDYFDPSKVTTSGTPYEYSTADVSGLDPLTGQPVEVPTDITTATVDSVGGPTSVDVTGVDVGPAATVGATAGPSAADILLADEQGRDAQLSGIEQLQFLSGGGESRALQLQRERGLRDVMAMMASQRGVPAAAVLREGIRGQENVDRAIAEAAAAQQMQAIQALGQQGGAMRQQDIGVATDQAQLEQQASLAQADLDHQKAMADAEFQQQTGTTQAQVDADQRSLQAQIDQETSRLESEQAQERAMADAQFEQQGYLTTADLEAQAKRQEATQMQQAALAEYQAAVDAAMQSSGFQQQALMKKAEDDFSAAMADAEFAQQAGLTRAELEATRRLENAGLETQAAIETARMETEVSTIAAQFQQQTNMSNAEFEMERQQAELQANVQLEAQRDSMMASLLGMGIDFETARMQVDSNLALERAKIVRDYYLGRMGARTELGRALIEGTSMFEGELEQVSENIDAINQILAGGEGDFVSSAQQAEDAESAAEGTIADVGETIAEAEVGEDEDPLWQENRGIP